MSMPARVALAAARSWAFEPTAVRCRDAADVADGPGLEGDGAARFAAFAAAWSGESLAPVGQPVVAPASTLGAGAVAAAVLLAAVRGAPSDMQGRLREFVGRGMLSAGDLAGSPRD
jgi:hypothetical protein